MNCLSKTISLNIWSNKYDNPNVILTPFGELKCDLFWQKLTKNGDNYCYKIQEKHLTKFYSELYNNPIYYNEVNLEKILQAVTNRAKYLMKSFGDFDEQNQQYFINKFQWKILFTKLSHCDPQRIWMELCILDSNNKDPFCSIHSRKLHLPYSYDDIQTGEEGNKDSELNHLRLWSIQYISNTFKNGKYQNIDDEIGIFMCNSCWKNYFDDKMNEERSDYVIIYGTILQGLWSCIEDNDTNTTDDNAKQLLRHLQHFIYNDNSFRILDVMFD